MAITRRRAWLLPLVFLAGYLVAWGTIIVDRQMVIDEQVELRQELAQAKEELRVREMMLDFGDNWQEMVIWNEKTMVPAKEEPKWNLPKKK